MKKLILSVAMLAAGAAAYAQKPAAGNITTEIGLTNLLGAPSNPSTLNLNDATSGDPVGMLRFRYFLSEGMAVRANLAFGMATANEVIDDDGLLPVVDKSEATVKGTTFGISLGIEKHLEGTSKLSPYLGAEFGFLSQTGSAEVTNYDGTNFSKGTSTEITGGGTTTLALNALIGADYYITERVYFGAELGIGLFASSNTADGERKVTNSGTSVTTKVFGSSASGFGLAPNAMGVIRLGIILF